VPAFVGRTEPLARLIAAYQAVSARPADAGSGWAGFGLVTGEAGIGKTALLTRFASQVTADGGLVVWGTCWEADQAPAWWPWTQVLRALFAQSTQLADAAQPELAVIVPELGPGRSSIGSDLAARVRLFDAAAQVLRRAAERRPVAVIIDNLHWADRSTVDLLRFLVHQPQAGALMLVGAYRVDEPQPSIAATLADLATSAELVPLRGLSADEVADLVHAVAGATAQDDWARLVHERSGGHPFYARELCRLLATTGAAGDVPPAVRAVIGRRLSRLSRDCATLLDAAAVAGTALRLDVVAEVTGNDPTRVATLTAEATAAGILITTGNRENTAAFVHDLYREAIYSELKPARRLELHHRVATALLRRQERGSPVFAAELAYHFTVAIPVGGPAPALAWAHSAARADAARFAFIEAADHLTRLRRAVDAAGRDMQLTDLVGVLTSEADLLLRAGHASQARALLDTAWTHATATGQADLLGAVALGVDHIDARFAMPRADLIVVLETARDAVRGAGTSTEAKLTAALARQLQHSVPADRPSARPLAGQAVDIARSLGDPDTLASCLLAQHDVLWTPGTATVRAEIAAAIIDLAKQANDQERHAQALLLLTTAQLEKASPAFRATLGEFAYLTQQLHQPRHDYVLRTRQAALALLDGDIDAGERLSVEAATLGEAVGESDAGNVRMSQRIEIIRARNEPAELRRMAAEAVGWWIGAPAHAHAVAAGFYARAGDLEAARRELDTVLALEDWRIDRSYLWSVFIGEMATAAIALQDRLLCQRLIEELLPVADTCAVNAAFVCFMGAHAHRLGLLYATLDHREPARQRLLQALQIHRRLGARAWEAETHQALANLGGPDADDHAQRAAAFREEIGLVPPLGAQLAKADDHAALLQRTGDMWQASYRGHVAYLRDAKGLHDLATLLSHPGAELSALSLAGGNWSERAHASRAEPVLDRVALTAYRRRLAELEDELTVAREHSDLAGQQRASDEREQILTELRRATRPGGSSRALANTAAERARKAVTARIRDAIRRIGDAHPELGSYLDRTIRTGTTCRYEPH
jgi:tetratricopeptide (TPR) repeat protein